MSVKNELLSIPSLRDEIYNRLRSRIISHYYPPNFRFDLSKLEAQLGVSRTPLKEALHRLENEGLVKIKARRGTFVTDLNTTEIAESFDVRNILESASAKFIIENATDEEVDGLVELSEKMKFLLDTADDYQAIVEEYIQLDYELHRLLISYTRNSKLISFHKRINTHLQIARVKQKFLPQQSRHTQYEHDEILKALKARDPEKLTAALDAHITFSKERTLKALRDLEQS